MAKPEKKKRTSKSEWLEVALTMLEQHGLDGVKIERIAKELKTSRSGFYWHFKDRAELLQQMLAYWRTEYTEVVIRNFALRDIKPTERLHYVMQMIEEHNLDRYEVHMRAWADHDPEAKKVLLDVYQQRFEFIRSLFAELGFSGCDLEMRTHLWLCYASHGKSMFPESTCPEDMDLIMVRHKILTS